jgi:hypothetical protein
MRLRSIVLALFASIATTAIPTTAIPTTALAQPASDVIYADQGTKWTPTARADFYTRDQGSQMIPLRWLLELKQPNGQPFLADSLSRYGYLPNPGVTTGLPVGFTASGPVGSRMVGMTCSACHTRQITAEGKTYRIDGGPGIVDFQSLLTDLDKAVGQVLSTPETFRAFAVAVLRDQTPDPDDVVQLREEVDLWYLRYHTIVSLALPQKPWGPARLDAVGMIFNRLTGLDIGSPPSNIIASNIKRADAPVRYPFLWNAAIQDKTQWPGFADNGNDILGLARNLGEVYGVFASFAPTNNGLFVNFLGNNSANFDGLTRLEDLIKLIGPPKWPWRVDTALAGQGKTIFDRPNNQGGCVGCHGITPGEVRLIDEQTWKTPIQNVGTDTREYDIMAWTAKTGVLQGAFIPLLTEPLKETDLAFNILATSVLGSIIEHVVTGGGLLPPVTTKLGVTPVSQDGTLSVLQRKLSRLPPRLRDLRGAYKLPRLPNLPTPLAPSAAPAPERGSYESRVMQGIWAAAPYLHNGSVPTLAELLKPPADRVKSFKVGSAYDTENIGLAVEQTQFGNYTLETTDCSDLNSGNSRCGHDFGTQLSPQEKKALLEYLKTL